MSNNNIFLHRNTKTIIRILPLKYLNYKNLIVLKFRHINPCRSVCVLSHRKGELVDCFGV